MSTSGRPSAVSSNPLGVSRWTTRPLAVDASRLARARLRGSRPLPSSSLMSARGVTTTVGLVALFHSARSVVIVRTRTDAWCVPPATVVAPPSPRKNAPGMPHSLPFTTTYSPSAPLEIAPSTPTLNSPERMTVARGCSVTLSARRAAAAIPANAAPVTSTTGNASRLMSARGCCSRPGGTAPSGSAQAPRGSSCASAP